MITGEKQNFIDANKTLKNRTIIPIVVILAIPEEEALSTYTHMHT